MAINTSMDIEKYDLTDTQSAVSPKYAAGLIQAYLAQDQNKWNPVKTPFSNNVNAIGAYDKTVFAAGTGGIIRSNDEGLTWDWAYKDITNDFVYNAISVVYNSSSYPDPAVLAGSNMGRIVVSPRPKEEEVYEGEEYPKWSVHEVNTTIYGATWDTYTHRGIGIVVCAGGKIFRTSDYGHTWEEITSPVTTDLYAVRMYGSYAVAVGKSGVILLSTDGGVTWTKQPALTTNTLRGVAMYNSTNCIAVGEVGTVVTCSNLNNDTSRAWYLQSCPLGGTLSAVDTGNKSSCYVGGGNSNSLAYCYSFTSSTVSVGNWTKHYSNFGVLSLAVLNSGNVLASSSNGRVYRYNSSGMAARPTLPSATDSSLGLVKLATGAEIKDRRGDGVITANTASYIGTASPSTSGNIADFNVADNSVSIPNTNHVYNLIHAYMNQLNSGVTKITLPDTIQNKLEWLDFTGNAPFVLNSTEIFKVTNSGKTFTKINGPDGGGYRRFAAYSTYYLVLKNDSTIHYSTNSGTSWNAADLSAVTHANLNVIRMYDKYAIAAGDGVIIHSNNYGVTWQNATMPADAKVHMNDLDIYDKYAWAAGYDGKLLYSTDYGATWQKAAINLPNGKAATITDHLNGVRANGSYVKVVGNNGTFLTSTNKTSFTVAPKFTNKNLINVHGVSGQGTSMSVITSDGIGAEGDIAAVPTTANVPSFRILNPTTTNWIISACVVGTYNYIFLDSNGDIYTQYTQFQTQDGRVQPIKATQSKYGLVRIATDAEAESRSGNGVLTPSQLPTEASITKPGLVTLKGFDTTSIYSYKNSGYEFNDNTQAITPAFYNYHTTMLLNKGDFIELNHGMTTANVKKIASNGVYFYILMDDNTLIKTGEYGDYPWTKITLPKAYNNVGAFGDTVTLVGDNGAIRRSTDKGDTWTDITSGVTSNLLDIDYYSPYYGTTTAQSQIICGSGGTVLISKDYGDTWTSASTPIAETFTSCTIVSNPQYISVCGNEGSILSSSDYGATWTMEYQARCKLNRIDSSGSMCICVGDTGNIYYGDWGRNWEIATFWNYKRLNTGVAVKYYDCCMPYSRVIVAIGNYGRIAMSTEYGKKWIEHGFGFGPYNAVCLSTNGQMLIGGNNGRLIHSFCPYVKS